MARKRLIAALIAGVIASNLALAQSGGTVVPAQPTWHQLNASQRTALMPLAKEWDDMPDAGKMKWLGIAVRYSKMTPEEQARLQRRMREWVALSPAERDKARAQYKNLRTVPADERKLLSQKWQEYDALPSEEKQRLQKTPKPLPKLSPKDSPDLAQGAATASSGPVVAPRVIPPKPLILAPITVRKPFIATSSSAPR